MADMDSLHGKTHFVLLRKQMYQRHELSGDLDHVATAIAELSCSLKPNPLIAPLSVVKDVPKAQRLGYAWPLVVRHMPERKQPCSRPFH